MELDEIRKGIDDVDKEIRSLFLKRMELASAAAEYKNRNALPILNKERERAVLAGMTEGAGGESPIRLPPLLHALRASPAPARRRCHSLPVSGRAWSPGSRPGRGFFPGREPWPARAWRAPTPRKLCDKLLPRGNIVYVRTFDAVFDAVESGLCEYGVLPIENSSNGSVRTVYDLLRHRGFSIVRMTRLLIRHELLVKPGTRLADVKTIYSHEQALGQCARYLSTLTGVKTAACANTAVAAKMVRESSDGSAAAISSPSLARSSTAWRSRRSTSRTARTITPASS